MTSEARPLVIGDFYDLLTDEERDRLFKRLDEMARARRAAWDAAATLPLSSVQHKSTDGAG